MANTVPDRLRQTLERIPRPALAFSGGTDSVYLLYACSRLGIDVAPYFVKGAFQTDEELERARTMAVEFGYNLRVLRIDPLSIGEIVRNDELRCYHCKKAVFKLITDTAQADGRKVVMDGTNASDDADSRPGMRATSEMGILSPLRDSGLTKEDVRNLSREAGLPTWDMPSDSCLATRIPTGTVITAPLLERTYKAEREIRDLGFRGIRVRTVSNSARLEILKYQSDLLEAKRKGVEEILLKYYDSVSYGVREFHRWNRSRSLRP